MHPIGLKAIVRSSRGIRGVEGQRECKDCQSLGRHPNLRYVRSRVEVVIGKVVVGSCFGMCPCMHVHVVG